MNRKTNTLFGGLNTYVLKFLHMFFPSLSTFESCDLVSLSSYPSFLFFLEGELRKKNRRKIVSFLPVTLDDILNILAYTYCFTKPQNNKVLFKTPALNKTIKLEVNLLGIRLDDRSTYHFNLGSFWFEMRHSIQSLSHSSCFYRVSKTHFHFSFSASCQRNKFCVARSSIFARNLF